MNRIAELAEKANKLPLLPGVYLMLNAEGTVIYVGKAKKLKNRVTSYFHGDHLPKVAAMVSHVNDFQVIVASSELEALVLENSLIKRHKPKYNILLKDDKGYPFIRLDVKSPYPRPALSAKAPADGARYFGPFGARSLTRDIIDTASAALGLPTCTREFPRDIGKQRPCLQYQLGNCRGWCLPEAKKDDYDEAVRQLILLLEGRDSELTAALRSQMEQAAEELRFEEAAALRNRLRSIQSLTARQKVIASARADTDAVAFRRGARCCFTVLHYTGGDLSSKDVSFLPEPLESDAEALSGLLRQYYASRQAAPRAILVQELPDDGPELEAWLQELSGHKVSIEVPQRGDRAAFLQKAVTNADEEILRSTTESQRREKTLEWLQKTIGLAELPRRIEAYDISNTGSTGIVASMTVHVDGKPLKKDYRRFKIKTLTAPDDYASMAEVISRRFTRAAEGDGGFAVLPDVLFIDGGQGQVNAAREAMRSLGYNLPVYGMVKDDRHRTRALVDPEGGEIGLQGNPAAFALVGRIQEETHRFAIEYHRSLRDTVAPSVLMDIPGIGEKRCRELLRHFGSLKAVRAADLPALRQALPESLAQRVYDALHAAPEKEEPCE